VTGLNVDPVIAFLYTRIHAARVTNADRSSSFH